MQSYSSDKKSYSNDNMIVKIAYLLKCNLIVMIFKFTMFLHKVVQFLYIKKLQQNF